MDMIDIMELIGGNIQREGVKKKGEANRRKHKPGKNKKGEAI